MSARAHADAVVDHIWHSFKTVCSALRTAKNITERNRAIEQVQNFLGEELHRQYVQKWRGWGLLFSSLLYAVKADVLGYLGLMDLSQGVTTSRKRKLKTTIPRLEHWHYLRNELAAVHAVDEPMLHLDRNGRECIQQLFAFAAAVIGRESSSTNDIAVETRLEGEAWQTVHTVVQFRVYCAVLEYKELQDVLELALASIEHENMNSNSSNLYLRAEIIHQILKNCPFDLHDWLPKLVLFITKWLDSIGHDGKSNAVSTLQDVAAKILEVLTDLSKTYFTTIGPLILEHGAKALHYIQRSWKLTSYRLQRYFADFIVQFLQLYKFHADSISNKEFDRSEFFGELKVILGIFLDPKEFQQVLSHSKSTKSAIIIGAPGSLSSISDIDNQTVSYFVGAADVIYHHDRLILELLPHTTADEIIKKEAGQHVGMKRRLSISDSLAWELLLENICYDTQVDSDLPSASPGTGSIGAKLSQQRDRRPSPALIRSGGRKHQVTSWLLLLLTVLCRHGEYYLANRIGDLMLIMSSLVNHLSSKKIDHQQHIALHVLIQLACLCMRNREIANENFDEQWKSVWSSLLRPDLPYSHATLGKDEAGEAVLNLLNCCVTFGLIPHAMIAGSRQQLWNLPIFQPSSLQSGEIITTAVSYAPICFLISLLDHVQLPDDIKQTKGGYKGISFLGLESTDSDHMPTQLRLLQALFNHLQRRINGEEAITAPNTKSSDRVKRTYDEGSPILYAMAIAAFFRPLNQRDNTAYRLYLPLLKKLEIYNRRNHHDSIGPFLSGFGIHFCMHENGLDYLSYPYPHLKENGPDSFPHAIRNIVENAQYSYKVNGMTEKHEKFERLRIPSHLLQIIHPRVDIISPLNANTKGISRVTVPSISRETVVLLQAHISEHFTNILTDLTERFSAGMDSIMLVQLIASALDVGVVLAALFIDENVPHGENLLKITQLLNDLLAMIADHWKPATFNQARYDRSASDNIITVLAKFHSIILILQGGQTLTNWSHPSADPIDLCIPTDFRPSIRKIIGAIEEGLALIASDTSAEHYSGSSQSQPSGLMLSKSLSATSVASTHNNSLSGNSWDWESAIGSGSTLTPLTQTTSGIADALDESDKSKNRKLIVQGSMAQNCISLWCFRVLLLLKKDIGIKSVREVALDVQFPPDFLLGIAVLLCGIPGSDSLDLFIKIVEYCADEATQEGVKTNKCESFNTIIFKSEVLNVLRLAGLTYEKRKREHSEEIPVTLLHCARSFLDANQTDLSKDRSRMSRKMELQCLEVFFRLDPDMFGDFFDISMARLVDTDFEVRIAAVQGLQTLYYMYPDGCPQVFKDFRERLLPLLPDNSRLNEINDGESTDRATTNRTVKRLDTCLTVLLSLYVSACSSCDVVAEVMVMFGRLATSTLPAYTNSDIIYRWMSSIASYYEYPCVLRLLDDHFGYVWSQFMAVKLQSLSKNDLIQGSQILDSPRPNPKELLTEFPVTVLLRDELEHSDVFAWFAEKIDIILPLAVQYDCVGDAGKRKQFNFVDQCVAYFFRAERHTEEQLAHVRASIEEQLITDLFALSFMLQSSLDRTFQEMAQCMIAVAEEKASTKSLSVSHLGHVVSKIAQYNIWNLACGSEHPGDPELFRKSVMNMKGKYSGFEWARMNLGELLGEFYVMMHRTELCGPMAIRAVDCFQVFVREILEAVSSNFVLQQLLLRICFQSIHHLNSHGKEVTRKLTFLVRDSCEQFMKSTDMFGKYLEFVVQEINDILVRGRSVTIQAQEANSIPLKLSSDDVGNLEWVIFAICNNMASGLGKYALNLDVVPMGISASLDKLSSLITASRKVVIPDNSVNDLSNSDDNRVSALRSIQQIELFIQKESASGMHFYNPSPLIRLQDFSQKMPARSKSKSDTLGRLPASKSMSTLRLALLESSIRKARDSNSNNSNSEMIIPKNLLEKIANVLLYLCSTNGDSTIRENVNTIVGIADTLGELGALDGTEFDLSPAADSATIGRLYQRQFHRCALSQIKGSFITTMYERLLVYLSALMFEARTADANVVAEAIYTLKTILRLKEGKNALSKSKPWELKQFLEPFAHSPPSTWSTTALTIAEWNIRQQVFRNKNIPTTQDRHLELWNSPSKLGFETWVCSLTSFLVRESADPVLIACTRLISIQTELAVFLFPYALWSILMNRQGSKTAQIVNAGIGSILKNFRMGDPENGDQSTPLSPCENQAIVPLKVVQLLIHTINFLRETEKIVFVESNGRDSTSRTPNTNPHNSLPSSNRIQHLNQLAYGCLIDVDLLDVAAAAVAVKMPYSAMQYVEMWLEENYGGSIRQISASGNIDLDDKARQILVSAFRFDSNIDGIYGVNDGRTFASQLVSYNREGSYTKALPLYDALLQCSQSGSQTTSVEGLLKSLQKSGYNHLLEGYLHALQSTDTIDEGSPVEEYRYELAWKNLQWDSVKLGLSPVESLQPKPYTPEYSHQRMLYRSLKALAHQDIDYLLDVTTTSKQEILRSLQLSLRGFECTQDFYNALLYLQSIREIEQSAQWLLERTQITDMQNDAERRNLSRPLPQHVHNTNIDDSGIGHIFKNWKKRYCQIRGDFDKIESLLSLEEVLVRVTQPPECHQILSKLYLSLASFSRKANRVAVAYKALMKLDQLDQQGYLGIYAKMQWEMQKAKLLWYQQEGRSAIWIAKRVEAQLTQYLQDPTLLSKKENLQLLQVAVLTVTGKWIAQQRSESSQVIIEQYFQKATELVDSMNPADISKRVGDAAKAHIALANYMADMYHQVHTRVTSREWLAGKRVAEARKSELEECLAMPKDKQIENRSHIHALNKEVEYDLEERTRVEASVVQFLTGALRSFGKGLTLSPKAELAVVFRLLSLWFSNQMQENVNLAIQEVIEAVPSYKFVPLSYQIMSRIGSVISSSSCEDDGATIFQHVLSILVLKLCQDHPYHALVQIIALKNSIDVEGKGALEFRTNVGDAKAQEAKKYLDELRKTEQKDLLDSLDILSTAYIQLALFDTREYHKTKQKIALSKVQITGLNGGSSHHSVSFDQCLRDRTRRGSSNRAVMPPVLTSTITPRADRDYSSVVRVLSFEPMFSITDSGIHRPKIIYCYGSNGRRFKQLVKGKDDTRQDLVIEQVFDTVNQFLQEDHATRQRKLRLRTYKVVPLSPIAGVLEWVDGTVPWGSYLVGRTSKRLSAHERYHPHEWKHMECRTYLKNATDKFAAYRKIEQCFTPVFHHFFLERFPDAAMWYHRRLEFIQSVAVTSIVGYILGIGDRHSQNILIDEATAELVHIDFGVVFDQGMALFTPETVPFRLTRDLVDGMGVSGCDGVFTRCCEATLQLLRKKSASVVTILEVFVHDPLYRWTLSPLKALRIQEGGEQGNVSKGQEVVVCSSTEGSVVGSDSAAPAATADGNTNNDAAARALIRVKQKLEGYEDLNGNALSIEGQVKQLISAAQNPHNLCNLFPGWAPWL